MGHLLQWFSSSSLSDASRPCARRSARFFCSDSRVSSSGFPYVPMPYELAVSLTTSYVTQPSTNHVMRTTNQLNERSPYFSQGPFSCSAMSCIEK